MSEVAGDRRVSDARDNAIALLVEENDRLRREYRLARRNQYRQAATGLVVVGVVSVLAAVVLPPVREVLLVLGAIGTFAGILTYYLSPEAFVAADVGERVYASLAENQAALADALGLRDVAIYVPFERQVMVYVPDRLTHRTPADGEGPLVTEPGVRGLLLESTGSALLETVPEGAEGEPIAARTAALADALVEQFELVDRATVEVDGERAYFRLADSAFGDLDRFDHPVPSFLAAGIAATVDRPVHLGVDRSADGSEWLITCGWDR